jgi:hypothetical protein
MTRDQIVHELRGLIQTRDFLITRLRRNRSMRTSERAMTMSKYDREKEALRLAIEKVNRAENGG